MRGVDNAEKGRLKMKFSRTKFIHLFIFSIVALSATHALAVPAADFGIKLEGSFTKYGCYKLSDVSLQPDGYIKNIFLFRKGNCKQTILYVETVPKGKIRGVDGIKGTSAGNSFSITVEPDTIALNIEMAGYEGKLAGLQFKISKYISAAKRQNSGWQTAWKHSEQSLQEASNRDKSPPQIILQSPDVTPQRQAFRVDTYQTFIRGRVSDEAGVATVLVNGNKAGVKSDGSFAKKVKLAFGTNQIRVQAEDIHGNVAERTFAIIREEFIPDEVIADVDIPKKTKMNNPN